MSLDEKDRGPFKEWLLPKLDKISDADSAVLADYVLALVTAEGPIDNVKQNSIEALSDFLQDHTRSFVNEVISVIESRSWVTKENGKTPTQVEETNSRHAKLPHKPSRPPTSTAQIRTSRLNPSAVPYQPATAASSREVPHNHVSHQQTPRYPAFPSAQTISSRADTYKMIDAESKKRKRNGRDESGQQSRREANQPSLTRDERTKRLRRKQEKHNNSAAGTQLAPALALGHKNVVQNVSIPRPPTFTPLPPLDSTNAASMLAAFAATFGMVLPGNGASLPTFPFTFPLLNPALANTPPFSPTDMPKQRCLDYDKQGFCLRGSFCSFDHGDTHAQTSNFVPEYDPNFASRGLTWPGNNKRDGSQANPFSKKDRASRESIPNQLNRSLFIDHIPTEYFKKPVIKAFFSAFGPVVRTLKIANANAEEQAAIVEFSNRTAACQALASPKAFFDNRFVTVTWAEPAHFSLAKSAIRVMGKGGGPGNGQVHRQSISSAGHASYAQEHIGTDHGDLEKQQAEAQKAFQMRRDKITKVARKAEQVEKQLWLQETEIQDLRMKIIEKAKENGVEAISRRLVDNQPEQAVGDLAALQAEAEKLFTHREHDAANHGSPERSVSNGASDRSLGLSAATSQGFKAHSSVRRLDNRPRRVAIARIEPCSEKDEAVRQYLHNMQGCDVIQIHPERPNTLVANFTARYLAEMFINEASKIPGLTKADLSWVANGFPLLPTPTKPASPRIHSAEQLRLSTKQKQIGVAKQELDVDLDVADDTDTWL